MCLVADIYFCEGIEKLFIFTILYYEGRRRDKAHHKLGDNLIYKSHHNFVVDEPAKLVIYISVKIILVVSFNLLWVRFS